MKYNINVLKEHNLYATGTTGRLISNIVTDIIPQEDGLTVEEIKPLKNKVTCLFSGSLGGDQQIGSMIAKGEIDVLVFFCDNLIVQGHQQDVGALSRLASLYNIAFATNRTTADMILTSPLFNNGNYERVIPSVIDNYIDRPLFFNK